VKKLWRRILALGFRLLYNELAWLYDPVSWVVSLGRWRQWQRASLPFLPATGTVLEVGFGPGHLLLDLASAGYRPIGLDLSRAMLRQAQRRLQRLGLPTPLCRAEARALPFRSGAFDAIVVTFPTAFVYEAEWICQVDRALADGGRLIVVEWASFQRQDPASQGLEWLYRITGQRAPVPDLDRLLSAGGLTAWRETTAVDGTRVSLIIAKK
jgi:ubiquinone/menaquinone biosynthesis C-methylase UbiE